MQRFFSRSVRRWVLGALSVAFALVIGLGSQAQAQVDPVAIQLQPGQVTVAVPYGGFYSGGQLVEYDSINSLTMWDRTNGVEMSLPFEEDDGGFLIFLIQTTGNSFSAPKINGQWVDIQKVRCAGDGQRTSDSCEYLWAQ